MTSLQLPRSAPSVHEFELISNWEEVRKTIPTWSSPLSVVHLASVRDLASTAETKVFRRSWQL